MSTYRLGIDIGGTFTDAACVNEQTGEVQIVKVPSTPADPSGGFMAAVARGLHQCNVGGEAVRLVVHATTVATNALIELAFRIVPFTWPHTALAAMPGRRRARFGMRRCVTPRSIPLPTSPTSPT